MRKSAKNVDITDAKTVIPWARDCIRRHYRRRDFMRLLLSHGLSVAEYDYAIATYDKSYFEEAIKNIAEDVCERIRARRLNLEPIQYRDRFDQTSRKWRKIGCESAMQQILDYIAVYAAQDIFDRRIVLQQMSSIKTRGQERGVRMIRSWIAKDNKAAAYARKHNIRFCKRNMYHVKLDVRQCFPSAKADVFLSLFARDCGNEDLLWLWGELLKTHHFGDYNGMMIGALTSGWAVQYMMSYVYRYAMDLHYMRRGQAKKSITNSMFFMDDMLFCGANRAKLKQAVVKIIKFTAEKLQFEIKPNWYIHCIDDAPIDMMGYVVHGNSKITIRGSTYVHIRRNLLRYNVSKHYSQRQARRACSYYGKIKFADSRHIKAEYHSDVAKRAAAAVVSYFDRKAGTQHANGVLQ